MQHIQNIETSREPPDRAGRTPCPIPPSSFYPLGPRREMRAPVFLPAGFVRFGAHRALLAVADGFQTVGWDAELHQELLGGTRPAIAQTKVVFQRRSRRVVLKIITADHSRPFAGVVDCVPLGFRLGRKSRFHDLGWAAPRPMCGSAAEAPRRTAATGRGRGPRGRRATRGSCRSPEGRFRCAARASPPSHRGGRERWGY